MAPESRERLSRSVTESQGRGGLFCGRVRPGREDSGSEVSGSEVSGSEDSGREVSGREGTGQEDLYYTFFGLLLAAVTGANIRRKDCAAKLRSVDLATLDLVHAGAWLRAMKILRWLAVPRLLRMMIPASQLNMVDAFHAKKLQTLPQLPQHAYPQQDADSPYSRFLLGTLCTDFGQAMPEYDLDAYRLPNGLYANLKQHADYGVNATAAALFLLPKESCDATADALLALQEADGSFKAVASAPEGDVMSTATAAFALHRCGKSLRISVKPFLRECFRDNGFFAATPLDPDGDLEYAAYGLLMMGLLT